MVAGWSWRAFSVVDQGEGRGVGEGDLGTEAEIPSKLDEFWN